MVSSDDSIVAENSFKRSPRPINEIFGSLRRGKLGNVSQDLLESESNVTDSDSNGRRRFARATSVLSKEFVDKAVEISDEGSP